MPATSVIPEYLRPYIAKQDPSLYTPIDHASWRFILRVSRKFFGEHAHQKYLDGLKETGISTDRIPMVEEMDKCLSRFGWRAVAVNGFIPPAVFMEFQSLGILPIACEMRTLEHLAYTPAPDIVHEAAGHAPILADPEYSAYLRSYGEVSRKAIFSSQDMELYQAILHLSVVKEDPKSTDADIARAQSRFERAQAGVTYVSEANLLARMNWWTAEYGLVGDTKAPKIYGAGLLSSVGESYHCLGESVKKIPLTRDCIHTLYDITRPQPQLFVTPNFKFLSQVLEEVSSTMAYRLGGAAGLAKALQAATVTTSQLDSGLQISGIVSDFRVDDAGAVTFVRMKGPVQIAHKDREITGHGPERHADGFSSPMGRLTDGRDIGTLSDSELSATQELRFASGILLRGQFESAYRVNGRAILITFRHCTVNDGSELLFQPEWGPFDLAVGTQVSSVFGGSADRASYLAKTGGYRQTPLAPKCNLTPENKSLNELYAKVRAVREKPGNDSEKVLSAVVAELDATYPQDWLLRVELMELAKSMKTPPAWEAPTRDRLRAIGLASREHREMIDRGLALL